MQPFSYLNWRTEIPSYTTTLKVTMAVSSRALRVPTARCWRLRPVDTDSLQAVIYEFSPGRAGERARAFLTGWQGKLVCDDFADYKAGFNQGITEIGCWAPARRKFYDLHAARKSSMAEQALAYIAELYEIEAGIKTATDAKRKAIRQTQSAPNIDALYHWLIEQRQRSTCGCGDEPKPVGQPQWS